MKRELDIGEPISAALPPDEDPDLPQAGFELKPGEVAVHLEIGGSATVTHIFSRLMDRGERINTSVAAGKQELEGEDIILDAGDSDTAYTNAWDHMIKDVIGYRLGGKPASLEAARDRIKTQQKRAAIDATNQLYAMRPETDLDGGVDLDAGSETRVVLRAKQGGGEFDIICRFGAGLGDRDLRDLRRKGMRFSRTPDGNLIAGSIDALRKVEEIFDRLIESVEGYLVEGAPVMESKDWRREVPIDHKAVVVAELRRRERARTTDPS